MRDSIQLAAIDTSPNHCTNTSIIAFKKSNLLCKNVLSLFLDENRANQTLSRSWWWSTTAASAGEGGDNLQWHLFDWRMFSSEDNWKINAVVAPLAPQPETLIRSVRELSKRSWNHSTDENMASERSRSTGQRSDMVTKATRQPRSDLTTSINPFHGKHSQHLSNTLSSAGNTPSRKLHYMAPEDATDGETDDQADQIMAAITDLLRQLLTTQAKTKLLQKQAPVFKRQHKKYNVYGHFFLNHIRPFKNKL